MNQRPASVSVVHVEHPSTCENCKVRQLCLPVALNGDELEELDLLVRKRAPLKNHEYVYRIGDKFHSLYAIRSGAVKTYGLTSDGKEQITGFHLPGEIVGMDAIGSDVHACNAVALEVTDVCELPYNQLEEIGQRFPMLQHELACMMSREIRAESSMLIMIGKMNAEQRIACFLHNLHHRMRQRGGEPNMIDLPMSREDIGNYLGLTLETVSRRLGFLQSEGVIKLEKRRVTFRDVERLSAICAS